MEKEVYKLKTEDYQAVLDKIADGVFVINGEGIVIGANKAIEENGGKKLDEVIGRSIVELEAEGYCTEFVSKKVIATGRTETALQRTKDNRELLVTGIPHFDDKGNLKMVIASERDVTELNKMKKKLLKVESINKQYQDELAKLREISGRGNGNGITSISPKMKSVMDIVYRVAGTDATILILGDSGTGKEVLANTIHLESLRNDKPFVKVNCGAIPENLIESEFFGYAEGAFTGATKGGKLGYFSMANGGTLLLDEVGEIPLNLQVKLLRAIQEREIMPVGAEKPIKLDIRIIAATNKPLDELVKEGRFRQDLYYRLSVVTVQIPPLKERKEDIIELSKHFVEKINEKYGFDIQFSAKAYKQLLNYNWPGNVRELENFIERIMVTSEEDVIDDVMIRRVLPDIGFEEVSNNKDIEIKGSLAEMIDEYEGNILSYLYDYYQDTGKMAKALKTTRSTINRKMVKHKTRRTNA